MIICYFLYHLKVSIIPGQGCELHFCITQLHAFLECCAEKSSEVVSTGSGVGNEGICDTHFSSRW